MYCVYSSFKQSTAEVTPTFLKIIVRSPKHVEMWKLFLQHSLFVYCNLINKIPTRKYDYVLTRYLGNVYATIYINRKIDTRGIEYQRHTYTYTGTIS